MPNIWFTADTHFGHANIIKFSNRPFADVTEMDEALIRNWNACVSPKDEIYHLGDVGMCSVHHLKPILERLNGRIYLIRGNHESAAMGCKERFEWIRDYYELSVKDNAAPAGENRIILLHYAMRVWNHSHYGTWQLYGHSHGSLPDDPAARSIDVGVDCHDYRPLHYDEVRAIMARKTWEPPFGKSRY